MIQVNRLQGQIHLLILHDVKPEPYLLLQLAIINIQARTYPDICAQIK